MTRYRLTQRPDRDLVEICLYTAEAFGTSQADRYAESMRTCFDMLADNPRLVRKADAIRPGLRHREHAGHVILHREDAEVGDLLILAVIHARMRPDLALADLP